MTVNQETVLIIYLAAVKASLGETQTGNPKVYFHQLIFLQVYKQYPAII